MLHKVSMTLMVTNVNFAIDGSMIRESEKELQCSVRTMLSIQDFLFLTLNFFLIFKLILHTIRVTIKITCMR